MDYQLKRKLRNQKNKAQKKKRKAIAKRDNELAVLSTLIKNKTLEVQEKEVEIVKLKTHVQQRKHIANRSHLLRTSSCLPSISNNVHRRTLKLQGYANAHNSICKLQKFIPQISEYDVIFYDDIEKIGNGQFGSIQVAKFKKLDINIAVKTVDLKKANPVSIRAEAIVMSLLSGHKAFPFCFGILDSNQILMQLFAYEQCGKWHSNLTFSNYMKTSKLCLTRFLIALKSLIEGYLFMHKNNILHNDIKGDNVLVSLTETPIIIDFGKCSLKNNPVVHNVKDSDTAEQYKLYHRHIAPELIANPGTPQSEATDCFSIGRMIKHLCCHVHNSENILNIARELKSTNPSTRITLRYAYQKLKFNVNS